MGTNFYWRANSDGQLPCGLGAAPDDRTSPQQHLGKRSAAGRYCYDCGVPLVEEVRVGEHGQGRLKRWCSEAIHGSNVKPLVECPLCDKAYDQTTKHLPAAAAVELGFARPVLGVRPDGVSSAASFSWAQEPARVLQHCLRHPEAELVEDEYGTVYTGGEFVRTAFAAPLWFTTMIGEAFS